MTRREAPQGPSAVAATAIRPRGYTRDRDLLRTCHPYARAAVMAESDNVMSAPQGQRTKALFKFACVAGELAGGGLIDFGLAEAACLIVGHAREIPDAEKHVRRGMDRGMLNPRVLRELRSGRHIEDRDDALRVIAEWYDALDARGSQRRICTAIGARCLRDEFITVRMSFRSIAEEAGVSLGTVQRHAPRIGRWVRVTSKGKRFAASENATEWRLVLRSPRLKCEQGEALPVSGVGELFSFENLRSPAADAWDGRPSDWHVYLSLDFVNPLTVSELIASTGYSRATVYRVIRRLEEGQLALGSSAGWTRLDDRPATFDTRDQRRRDHERHRQRHAAFLRERFGGES